MNNVCKNCYLRLTSPLQLQLRFVSGYKLSEENYEKLRKTRKENVKSEFLKYREKVDLSVIKKTRPPLNTFEVVTHYEIQNTTGENFNKEFINATDAPKYNGWYRYYKTAERIRRELKTQDHWWKSFDKVLKDIYGDTTKYEDIGLESSSQQIHKNIRQDLIAKRNDVELERLSRHRELKIDFDLVLEQWETSKQGKVAIKQLCHHFGLFKDLFVDKDFTPHVHMNVDYEDADDCELINPVYYGNVLSPSDASKAPLVSFDSEPDDRWTIVLVNPDGHLEDNDKEYLHWMVGNIQGNDVESGTVLMDYLQPIPCDGTGYHRMVFLLFKQKQEMNFENMTKSSPCTSLRERDFLVREFFETHQEVMTPASIRFFQCKWDMSVKNVFHKVLDMEEPVYAWEQEFKLPRLEKLYEYPDEMTYGYMKAFQPAEPVYPDGSLEANEILRQSVIRATKVTMDN